MDCSSYTITQGLAKNAAAGDAIIQPVSNLHADSTSLLGVICQLVYVPPHAQEILFIDKQTRQHILIYGLQVCTYDLWDRVTTEGYGWLALGGICPGSSTQYVDTWKPLGR